jgi:general secretion pathway protein D
VVKIIDEIITGQRKSREDDAKTANAKPSSANPSPIPNANANANASKSTSQNANANSNASLQFSEFVGLSADERINAIVAYGTQQDLKTLETLIQKIDIPLPQVRIEAIITEVRLTEDQSTGLKNFELLFNDVSGPEAGIAGTSLNLSNNGIETVKASGESSSIIIDNFSIKGILEITESDSNVKVLSTPSIVVSHNEEGVINVSDSIPIVTGSSSTLSSTSTLTNVRSSIEYRDIGLTLEVTPLIGADGSVQMEINQTANQLSSKKSKIDSNELSIIGKREANSTITVADGQVAVLAGLQQNSIDNTQSYFPLIGRMPILKNILSNTTKDYIRTELILFIRPTVIRTPNQSQDLTKELIKNYEEGDTIEGYLEDGTIREIYMKGSRLSPKKKEP